MKCWENGGGMAAAARPGIRRRIGGMEVVCAIGARGRRRLWHVGRQKGRRRWGCVKCLGNGGGNTAALALLLHVVYTLNAAQLQAKGLQIG